MPKTHRFSFRSLEELKDEIARQGLDLPTTDDLAVLATPVRYGRLTVPNRLAVHPMEGCDGTPDGAPDELTFRRYRRFAAGGAGLIWVEATAVVPDGRANPRQLWLHEGSADGFKAMLEAARQAAVEADGCRPVFVLQLTHSGRYSRPGGAPSPIIAHHNPILDPRHGLSPEYPLISDEELDLLQDAWARAAMLAAEAGFDAVDVKSCHRYLVSELLACHTRENSRYGGGYENRTRLLRETVRKIRQAVGDEVEVTCRLNAYDAIDYPYGWGVDREDVSKPDLTDPLRLIGQLREMGFGGINITAGNPYFNPFVNRPADWMIANAPDPPEHPLAGVARMVGIAGQVQRAYPDLTVVGSGYSWLRQYFPHFAAAAVSRGWVSIVGLGRGAVAYPDFARDILRTGAMDRHKVCVACSSCTQIMRDGGGTGCVVRDSDVYAPILKQGRSRDRDVLRELASRCRGCADAMCTAACPAGVDVPGFLGALADGDEKAAFDILRAANVLPGICGAVCPVEVQCQSACIQNVLGEGPVPIAEIQKNLSLRAMEAGWAAMELPGQTTGRRMAVVGAGPGGLSAAAELLRRGHCVTVFERGGQPGGKLVGVIPSMRLPADAAQAEIQAVFGPVPPERLEWRFGRSLGADFTLDDLTEQGYDAVVLAVGLGNGPSLASEGRPEGLMEAGDFLRHMNRNAGHSCPARVAVIGGGNTAVDAAVCAARRGAEDVYLVYRRSYNQMPAWPDERDEALHAGVHLMLLCQPVGYQTDTGGRLTGVRLVRTELGPPDDSGRRGPVHVAGSEFVLAVDMALEAMGEHMEPMPPEALAGVEQTSGGLIKVEPGTFRTTRPGVWAVGDVVNGGTTVVQAVAEGRRAALDIEAALTAPEG